MPVIPWTTPFALTVPSVPRTEAVAEGDLTVKPTFLFSLAFAFAWTFPTERYTELAVLPSFSYSISIVMRESGFTEMTDSPIDTTASDLNEVEMIVPGVSVSFFCAGRHVVPSVLNSTFPLMSTIFPSSADRQELASTSSAKIINPFFIRHSFIVKNKRRHEAYRYNTNYTHQTAGQSVRLPERQSHHSQSSISRTIATGSFLQ